MGGSSAGWVGLKLWIPPPLIILRVSWVGLQPPFLSLVTGALSGCLLVPPSALSCAGTMPKSLCGCGALVGASEQAKREHLKSERHKQWEKAKKSQRPLNFPKVTPVQPTEASSSSSTSSSSNSSQQSNNAAQSGSSAQTHSAAQSASSAQSSAQSGSAAQTNSAAESGSSVQSSSPAQSNIAAQRPEQSSSAAKGKSPAQSSNPSEGANWPQGITRGTQPANTNNNANNKATAHTTAQPSPNTCTACAAASMGDLHIDGFLFAICVTLWGWDAEPGRAPWLQFGLQKMLPTEL